MALPHLYVEIQGRRVPAIVDSGCSQTLVSKDLVRCYTSSGGAVVTVDGSRVSVLGERRFMIRASGRCVGVDCVIVKRMLSDVQVILGMDFIKRIGGIHISQTGRVILPDATELNCLVSRNADTVQHEKIPKPVVNKCDQLAVDDDDFFAYFNGSEWLVKWKWAQGNPPVADVKKCPNYQVSKTYQEAFDKEIGEWIKLGWLQEFHEKPKAVIPLLAVYQAYKNKVRPVLDYRELNRHLSSHTGDSVVCLESLRKWRTMGDNVKILDLEKAYLQIHVEKELWSWQCVRYKGKVFALTRLGFGLCSAPRVMTAIVNKVLSMDDDIRCGTDSYIDDIIVNENVTTAERVSQHLLNHGLKTKPSAMLNGARVLGLNVLKKKGKFMWHRGNQIPEVIHPLTKRKVFAICGQLVGHFPVAGWLRVSCGVLKRLCSNGEWDKPVATEVEQLVGDVFQRLEKDDPVQGVWTVSSVENAVVWCDASDLALGVALEIDGTVIEDASWLRKKNDVQHINVAELDAIIKGANIAIKWKCKNVKFITDSQTVYKWVSKVIHNDSKVRTNGLSEIIIKRRLDIIRELQKEHFGAFEIALVESRKNKADILTRVKRDWLSPIKSAENVCCLGVNTYADLIKDAHAHGHLGVERTLAMAKLMNSSISREEVQNVTRNCVKCLSIDPAPLQWNHGKLECEQNWERLACDVTHFRGKRYLTVIDCGPSRHVIWRLIPDESQRSICKELVSVFREYGPPMELLLDNGLSFKGREFMDMLRAWGVGSHYRCAYKASGNGIVERCHRTIKRMASRSNDDPLNMVFWWNASNMLNNDSVLFCYKWRLKQLLKKGDQQSQSRAVKHSSLQVGDTVVVKPHNARCSTQWTEGKVTNINSETNIEIDGVPRHLSDIRPIPRGVDGDNPRRQSMISVRFSDFELNL